MTRSGETPIWPFYFGIFLSPLAGSGVIAILAALQTEFGIGIGGAGLTITAYMVPYAGFQLASGAVSDVYGRRPTLAGGFLVFAAGSAAAGGAPTFAGHLAARAVQGAGAAFVNPVVLAVLGELSPDRERGAAMGNLGFGVTLAVVAGPVVAGGIHVLAGWRWFFGLLAVAGVASAAAYAAVLPRDIRVGGSAGEVLGLLGTAVRRRDVLAVAAGGFLAFAAHVALQAYASDTMAAAPLAFREDRIGLALSLGASAGFLASPGGGRLADRWDRPPAIAAGFLLLGAGGLALGLAPRVPGFASFVAALFVANAGFYVLLAGFNAASVELMPESRGTPASVYNFARFLGYGLAPVAFAPLFGAGGLALVGAGAAAVALGGAALASRLPRGGGSVSQRT